MADASKTVRVNGLPVDIDEDRLRDKLLVHFLRAKNGGGEIESVTVGKATPVSALITFEDHRVAKRVVQRSRHVLSVEKKTYEVKVTEHQSLDPDKIIPKLSATVDYKQLPGGVSALSGLLESHPDIQINYDTDVELYTLRGSYTKVQAALEQLLVPESAGGKRVGQLEPPVQGAQKQHSQESEDLSRRSNKETVYRDNSGASRAPDQVKAGRPQGPSGSGSDLQPPGATTATSDEDRMLNVEADVFQYTQKNHQTEYQQMLSQYGVNVVEMTNQGLTTLFLRVVSETGDSSRDWEYLKLVRKAMSGFFQRVESTICQTPLSKSAFESVQGLERAKTTLGVKYSRLLLNEDEWNIYIIGSPTEVGQAKQFLLEQCKAREKKEDTGSPPSFSPFSSGVSGPLKEHRAASGTVPTRDSSAGKADADDNERKSDGAKKYKLATRFRDSQLGMLASRPADLIIRGGPLSPGGSKYPGPAEGYYEVSETAKSASDRIPQSPGPIPGDGSLFESGDALAPASRTPKKPPANSDALAKDTFSLSVPAPAGGGSTLKRASSFSGSSQPKVEVRSQGSHDDSSRPAPRPRPGSAGVGFQALRGTAGSFSAGLTMSPLMWHYIKETYGSQVDDLTSDVQVREARAEGSGDVTVTLRAGSQAKLSSCKAGLQKMVARVGADFSTSEVRLSELGITDPADENLLACCADVRGRFEKVNTHVSKKSLFLVGPRKLCSQVAASLREVFSGDVVLGAREPAVSAPSMSHWDPTSFSKSGAEQPRLSRNHCQAPSEDGSGSSPLRVTNVAETKLVNGCATQPVPRVPPVVREKLKLVDAVELDGQRKAGHRGVQSKALVAKDGTLRAAEESRGHAEAGKPPEEPGSDLGGVAAHTCTPRGTDGCVACQRPQPRLAGIQGQMSYCKLHMSLPGHKKDASIKLTYRIPNGIQEEGHPSPGQPFQGGVFEAYFPDCDVTSKLLPRLETAFRRGLTFTVMDRGSGAKVAWDRIPHKTSVQGGKSGNGYPDSTYLAVLSQRLTALGVE